MNLTKIYLGQIKLLLFMHTASNQLEEKKNLSTSHTSPTESESE